ncbi:MAG: LytTR family DNA-binding domain-containing protein [Oscillospiraceae bacterium]|nr:LytTR family DNA-binding domain-containing protein [Oscillospiraceae bacterium]
MVEIVLCDTSETEMQRYAELFERIAAKYQFTIAVSMINNGYSLLVDIQNGNVTADVVFLETDLASMSGIVAAQKLRDSGFKGSVVFLTYADQKENLLSAFDAGAENYIVKGACSIDRVERVLFELMTEAERRKKQFFTVETFDGSRKIELDKIKYFKYSRGIVTAVHDGGRLPFFGGLEKLENRLWEFHFLRIHKNILVQTGCVEYATRRRAMLYDGTRLPVGQKYSATLDYAVELELRFGEEQDR